jgi:hypothetical protein
VVGIYSQVTAACRHTDIRVLLTGIKDPFLSTVHTRKQIELVSFDHVFEEGEVDYFFKILPCKCYTEVLECYSNW